jgi:Acetyltransferase (GNAT) family
MPPMRCSQCSKSVVEIAGSPASTDDVRAIQRRRNLDDISLRLSLQSAERGTSWVARDGGEVIGVAIAHDSDDERYIGDLFLEPSYRGQDLAERLLEAAFSGSDDRSRAMRLDPSDPASLALAFRQRTAPREPIIRFAGPIPREEELAKMAAGEYRFQVDAVDPEAHGFALSELDRQSRGTSRRADHAQFAQLATGYAFFLSGECVGYAYVWPDGRIGPLACASEAYLVQIFAYALVTLTRTYSASWCTALVPGSNRRIARAALRAGLRIHETFIFAADSSIGATSTYVGYHELAF